MSNADHVEYVYSNLLHKFRDAHNADPESERTTLVNGAIMTLEREWPNECKAYRARYGSE